MKVLMWGHKRFNHKELMWIVLWDGKNTYWLDDWSRPSSGYELTLKQMKRRGYFYVGEL